MISAFDPQQTQLALDFTVANYKNACTKENKAAIAEALRRRFALRYIDPVTPAEGKKMDGFTMVAISCLMIESLQSFCDGWKDTYGKSELAFCHFFDSHSQFSCFHGYITQFYKNVRCGILHQAETTGGWKITRKSKAPLFDPATLTINATLFLNCLRQILNDFCDDLKVEAWDSERWRNVLKKMDALCENCEP
jgi:hypothetical protein